MSVARDAAIGLGLGLVVVGAAWLVSRKLNAAAGELVGTIGDALANATGAVSDAVDAATGAAVDDAAQGAGAAVFGGTPDSAPAALTFGALRGIVPGAAASAAAIETIRSIYLWAWSGDTGDVGPPVVPY